MEESPDRRMRISRLAIYNSEKARGIMHTTEWKELMRQEQEWFDSWRIKRRASEVNDDR